MTGDWDIQLIRDIFCDDDAKVILAIPVTSEQENTLAWHYDQRAYFQSEVHTRFVEGALLTGSVRTVALPVRARPTSRMTCGALFGRWNFPIKVNTFYGG